MQGYKALKAPGDPAKVFHFPFSCCLAPHRRDPVTHLHCTAAGSVNHPARCVSTLCSTDCSLITTRALAWAIVLHTGQYWQRSRFSCAACCKLVQFRQTSASSLASKTVGAQRHAWVSADSPESGGARGRATRAWNSWRGTLTTTTTWVSCFVPSRSCRPHAWSFLHTKDQSISTSNHLHLFYRRLQASSIL